MLKNFLSQLVYVYVSIHNLFWELVRGSRKKFLLRDNHIFVLHSSGEDNTFSDIDKVGAMGTLSERTRVKENVYNPPHAIKLKNYETFESRSFSLFFSTQSS
jgi:hypothetical protein